MTRAVVRALLPVFAFGGLLVLAGSRSASRTAGFVVPRWAFPQHDTGALSTAHPFTGHWSGGDFAPRERHLAIHPPIPRVVAHGRRPELPACGFCHYADGDGAPENAMLAGLPPGYILEQIADLRSGARRSAWASYIGGAMMSRVAANATPEEAEVAARYFTSLQPRRLTHVVEAARIPRPVMGLGLYHPDSSGAAESLGRRLIEMEIETSPPGAVHRAVRYVAYVPPGSIARGRVLATLGRARGAAPCTNCHGPGLRGLGPVPPLAGRFPSYLLRQLLAFRTGTRASAAGAPMRSEAATLDLDDMIAVAAYAATLKP